MEAAIILCNSLGLLDGYDDPVSTVCCPFGFHVNVFPDVFAGYILEMLIGENHFHHNEWTRTGVLNESAEQCLNCLLI